jgi:hypothetical protein
VLSDVASYANKLGRIGEVLLGLVKRRSSGQTLI